MSGYRRAVMVCLALTSLVLSGCGGDNEPTPQGGATSPQGGATSPSGTGGTTVNGTLKEWTVLVQTGGTDVKAGSITFMFNNEGPNHKHELVIVKTETASNALPTKADGSVDEKGAGLQVIGEIAEFAAGTSQSKTFTLSAGKYVLFCNVVEDPPTADMAGFKAHYKLGMWSPDFLDVT